MKEEAQVREKSLNESYRNGAW